jgi:hypothetical protein
MMTAIQKIVEIPVDRRLVLDIPAEIPTGKTEMMVVFSPLSQMQLEKYRRSHKSAIEKARGIAKRKGATLTVDKFLRWNEEDIALEEAQYRERFHTTYRWVTP